jgi:hypothetical protein
MRSPVKLNRAGWPTYVARLSLAYDDPRPLAHDLSGLSPHAVSAAISCLRFGTTFKTTRPGRHEQSNRFLLDRYRGKKPVILDVGASDGSTSLDLIRALGEGFRNYFVTDLNIWVECGVDGRGIVYFRDRSGQCMLRASKRLLTYSDDEGAGAVLKMIARHMLRGASRVSSWRRTLLVQPELGALAATDTRIAIMHYDMFVPWNGERPDVIKVACVLHPLHFSGDQIAEALRVQCSNLAPEGRLLLAGEGSNDVEEFSVFRKTTAGMVLEYAHAGGGKAARYMPLSGIKLDSDPRAA